MGARDPTQDRLVCKTFSVFERSFSTLWLCFNDLCTDSHVQANGETRKWTSLRLSNTLACTNLKFARLTVVALYGTATTGTGPSNVHKGKKTRCTR